MSLNLGNLTNEYSSMSTEELLLEAADAEIELTEMLHSMENLENARKIQDLAKQSGSMECMNFAEELLGCSVEVQLPPATNDGVAQYKRLLINAISEFKHQIDSFEKNYGAFVHSDIYGINKEAIKKRIRNNTPAKTVRILYRRIVGGVRKYQHILPTRMIFLINQLDSIEDNMDYHITVLRKIVDSFEEAVSQLKDNESKEYPVKFISMLRWAFGCIRTGIAAAKSFNRFITQAMDK